MNKQKGWKEEMVDYFCVMFERASRENDHIVWEERLEDFISNLLTQQKKEIVEEVSKLVKTTNLVGLTGESAIFANEYNKALIDVLDILQANLLNKE